MNNSFIAECRELISSMPERTGDNARLAFRLAVAIDRLEDIHGSAMRQFSKGAETATFSPMVIGWIDKSLRG